MLGVPGLALVEGLVPEVLGDIPQQQGTKPDFCRPNAVFIGGGLSARVVEIALERLQPHGRLVANAVTLESESCLIALVGRYGGALTRIAVSHASPVGEMTGWRPAMPVTQWSLQT